MNVMPEKFVKRDGGSRRRVAPRARYLHASVGRPEKGRKLQDRPGGPELGDHLTGALVGGGRLFAAGTASIFLVGVALLVCACTRPEPALTLRAQGRTTATTDPLSAVDSSVVEAWRAAETAFFDAESQPDGYESASLDATWTAPELQTVKGALALQSFQGEIGEGPWDLGRPSVVSIGPNEASPTTAVVVSCVHDTQVLVDRATGAPVPGVLGSPDWAGTTSRMTLTLGGTWKLSDEAVSIDTDRRVACAGESP
jgi:hypothetical protein